MRVRTVKKLPERNLPEIYPAHTDGLFHLTEDEESLPAVACFGQLHLRSGTETRLRGSVLFFKNFQKSSRHVPKRIQVERLDPL